MPRFGAVFGASVKPVRTNTRAPTRRGWADAAPSDDYNPKPTVAPSSANTEHATDPSNIAPDDALQSRATSAMMEVPSSASHDRVVVVQAENAADDSNQSMWSNLDLSAMLGDDDADINTGSTDATTDRPFINLKDWKNSALPAERPVAPSVPTPGAGAAAFASNNWYRSTSSTRQSTLSTTMHNSSLSHHAVFAGTTGRVSISPVHQLSASTNGGSSRVGASG